jgi:hypothetical protein
MNMNEDLKQLEMATSTLPEQNLDAEAAALREGWRVLTGSLDNHNVPFDEAALLSKLQREISVAPGVSETKGTSGGWIVVTALVGGALAASLLLMVAVGGGWFGPQSIAEPTPAISPQMDLAAASNIKAEKESISSWDDPLDSQITVAAAQMQTLQKPALPLDASISTLNFQLQRMAQDMEDGAL